MSHLEWKFTAIELPVTFLSFGFLYSGILGFKSEQYFGTLDSCIFNSRRPPWFLCLVYSLPSNIFYQVLFSFYRTFEDRNKWALNLHSWKTIYLKMIGLFLSSSWCIRSVAQLTCTNTEKPIWTKKSLILSELQCRDLAQIKKT